MTVRKGIASCFAAAGMAAAMMGCAGQDRTLTTAEDRVKELERERRDYQQEVRRLSQRVERLERQLKERKWQCAAVFLSLPPEDKARLNLHLLDWQGESPWGADAMAKADIKAGHLNILTGGLNHFRSEGVVEHFRKRYNIQVYQLTDCMGPRAMFAVMDAYNTIGVRAIEQRFGAGAIDKALEEASQRSDRRGP